MPARRTRVLLQGVALKKGVCAGAGGLVPLQSGVCNVSLQGAVAGCRCCVPLQNASSGLCCQGAA